MWDTLPRHGPAASQRQYHQMRGKQGNDGAGGMIIDQMAHNNPNAIICEP